jgi:hypothetical protein
MKWSASTTTQNIKHPTREHFATGGSQDIDSLLFVQVQRPHVLSKTHPQAMHARLSDVPRL